MRRRCGRLVKLFRPLDDYDYRLKALRCISPWGLKTNSCGLCRHSIQAIIIIFVEGNSLKLEVNYCNIHRAYIYFGHTSIKVYRSVMAACWVCQTSCFSSMNSNESTDSGSLATFGDVWICFDWLIGWLIGFNTPDTGRIIWQYRLDFRMEIFDIRSGTDDHLAPDYRRICTSILLICQTL